MPEESNQTGYATLRDVLTIYYKYQRKILKVFFGIVLLAVLVSFFMTPVYQAESKITVKVGREHIYRSAISEKAEPIQLDHKAIILSETEILSTQDLIEQVLTDVGLEAVYPKLVQSPPWDMTPFQAAVLKFKKHLYVKNLQDSNVIDIGFQNPNPTIAAKVVNTLVDRFKQKHLEIFSNPQSSFLSKQAQTYHQELTEATSNLQDFKQEYGISDINKQRHFLLEERKVLDSELKRTQGKIKGAIQSLNILDRQIQEIVTSIPLKRESPGERKGIEEAKVKLLGLRVKEQNLIRKYRESSRSVKNVRDEIVVIENFIKDQEEKTAGQVTIGNNPIYQALELDMLKTESTLRALRAEEKEGTIHVEEIDAELSRLEHLAKELGILKLAVKTSQNHLDLYTKKAEEARVSQEMNQLQIANIGVIQKATIPVEPIRPQKALYIFLGVIFGGVTALGVALFSEYTQGGYLRPEYASKDLGLPIMANIAYKS